MKSEEVKVFFFRNLHEFEIWKILKNIMRTFFRDFHLNLWKRSFPFEAKRIRVEKDFR